MLRKLKKPYHATVFLKDPTTQTQFLLAPYREIQIGLQIEGDDNGNHNCR